MKLSLEELIKRLQEKQNPNLKFQETNVEDVEHSVRGLRLVTTEMREVEDERERMYRR